MNILTILEKRISRIGRVEMRCGLRIKGADRFYLGSWNYRDFLGYVITKIVQIPLLYQSYLGMHQGLVSKWNNPKK